MKRLNSLRARLVLWTILLEAVALLIAGVILVLIVQKSQNDQINNALRLGATQLNAVVEIRSGNYAIEATDDATLRSQGLYVWVLTAQGLVASNFGEAHQIPVPKSFPKVSRMADSQLMSGEPVRLYTALLTQDEHNLGVLVLGLSLRSSQTLMQQIFISLGIVIPISLLLSAIGGVFLANRALEPIAAITNTTRHINAADLSQRLRTNLSDDEIGQLADTLNTMFGRLDRAFQRERQFTSDVSHELRTPLSMLKAQLSLARSRPRNTETLTQMMADMETDVDRMTHLVEQMLALARLEQPSNLDQQSVDLTDTLRNSVRIFSDRARERQIELKLDLPERQLWLPGNADQLQQVFSNLIENAIKYSEPNGIVALCANQHENLLIVSIEDTGIGIEEKHLAHVFERFYRADSARARSTGGSGLGLAIAQAVVIAHRGEIQVESQAGKGTKLTVQFPIPLTS